MVLEPDRSGGGVAQQQAAEDQVGSQNSLYQTGKGCNGFCIGLAFIMHHHEVHTKYDKLFFMLCIPVGLEDKKTGTTGPGRCNRS